MTTVVLINEYEWLPPSIGIESVPKNYNEWRDNFFSETTIRILLIPNRGSLRVLFDKIASVYFIWEIY